MVGSGLIPKLQWGVFTALFSASCLAPMTLPWPEHCLHSSTLRV